jgi:hypothetical protein
MDVSVIFHSFATNFYILKHKTLYSMMHSGLIRWFVMASFCLLLTASVLGQNNRPSKSDNLLDFGIYFGGSTYQGDLTQSMPVLSESHLAGGAMIRYNIGSMFSLRAAAMYMRVSGDDKNFEDDPFRSRRNLSFRSNIWEFSTGLEWNILGWYTGMNSYAHSPYLFASLGVFRFNPLAYFEYLPGVPSHHPSLESSDKRWIELQPLSTEAQETTDNNKQKRYSLTQVSIPFGFGYKFQVSDHWTMGFEVGWRKTFTDYLDDISTIYWDDQVVLGAGGYMSRALKDRAAEVGKEPFLEGEFRGSEQSKDWYMFAGINITYRIFGGKDPCPSFK